MGVAGLLCSSPGDGGWQRASGVCAVLPTPHRAGDVAGQGPGRAVARAHISMSDESEIPPAQGGVGSSRLEPAQGDAGDCRNLFVWDRESCCHKL